MIQQKLIITTNPNIDEEVKQRLPVIELEDYDFIENLVEDYLYEKYKFNFKKLNLYDHYYHSLINGIWFSHKVFYINAYRIKNRLFIDSPEMMREISL